MVRKKIPIVILSTDSYSDLWPLIFKNISESGILETHFPVLVTESKEFSDYKTKTIKTRNLNWSSSIIVAIKKLIKMKYDYALFSFDDLFIKKININKIFELENMAIIENHDSLKFYSHSKPPYYNKFYGKFNISTPYLCVFTFTFWKLTSALNLLNPGESAWQFEHFANTRVSFDSKHFCVYSSKVKLVNAVIKGKVDTFIMNLNNMKREKKILLKNREKINLLISLRIQFARLLLKLIYFLPNSVSSFIIINKRKLS